MEAGPGWFLQVVVVAGWGADRPIVINMTVRHQCILGVTKVIGVQCITFSFPFVDICHWGLEDSEFVQGL